MIVSLVVFASAFAGTFILSYSWGKDRARLRAAQAAQKLSGKGVFAPKD